MKLYQLSNGNWVDLTTITSIRKIPRDTPFMGMPVNPDRLVLQTVDGLCEVLPCDDEEQATEMRDELAKLINAL